MTPRSRAAPIGAGVPHIFPVHGRALRAFTLFANSFHSETFRGNPTVLRKSRRCGLGLTTCLRRNGHARRSLVARSSPVLPRLLPLSPVAHRQSLLAAEAPRRPVRRRYRARHFPSQ